jgi:hypothetical protein
MAGAIIRCNVGWGARIRTWDGGTKNRSLTTWRRPNSIKCAGLIAKHERKVNHPMRQGVGDITAALAHWANGSFDSALKLRIAGVS